MASTPSVGGPSVRSGGGLGGPCVGLGGTGGGFRLCGLSSGLAIHYDLEKHHQDHQYHHQGQDHQNHHQNPHGLNYPHEIQIPPKPLKPFVC